MSIEAVKGCILDLGPILAKRLEKVCQQNFEYPHPKQASALRTKRVLSLSSRDRLPLLCKEGPGEVDHTPNFTFRSSNTPSKFFKLSSFAYRIMCNPRFFKFFSLCSSFRFCNSSPCTSPSTSITVSLSEQ